MEGIQIFLKLDSLFKAKRSSKNYPISFKFGQLAKIDLLAILGFNAAI